MSIKPPQPKSTSGEMAVAGRSRAELFANSNHLVGQAVRDRIDERHRAILPRMCGRRRSGGSQKTRGKEMITTAKAAVLFSMLARRAGAKKAFPAVVNGFTGSSIWASIYASPDVAGILEKGFAISGAAGRPSLMPSSVLT